MQVVNVSGADLLPVLSRLVRVLRAAPSPDNLSSVARGVLSRLRREGAQRLTDLARAESTSQPAMTQLIGRLEKEGLVLRRADASDGRGTVVEITPAGRRVVTRAEQRYAAMLDDLLGAVATEDREAIAAALPALGRLVRASD